MIGIGVVYLVKDPSGYELLDFSVAQLRHLTSGPYRIYGCCPGNDDETLRGMAAHGIAVQEVTERHPRASQEHSNLLDMDSWPIRMGWDGLYQAALTDQAPLAAIVRRAGLRV